jgi:hypothetical protein
MRDKHEEQITAFKENTDETKQDLREARQSAKFIEFMQDNLAPFLEHTFV